MTKNTEENNVCIEKISLKNGINSGLIIFSYNFFIESDNCNVHTSLVLSSDSLKNIEIEGLVRIIERLKGVLEDIEDEVKEKNDFIKKMITDKKTDKKTFKDCIFDKLNFNHKNEKHDISAQFSTTATYFLPDQKINQSDEEYNIVCQKIGHYSEVNARSWMYHLYNIYRCLISNQDKDEIAFPFTF